MDNWVNDSLILNCTELQHSSMENTAFNEAEHILDIDIQRSKINQISASIPGIPNMSNDECIQVWNILQSWNLECVFKTCIGKFLLFYII